ncbi:hypothetical protein HELRODRAFT_108742 [Helobdella robusta]|uniref:Uncharacterized protein n=1 Tax=Helobdella robusta TaxID=6412 RepID=T1EEM0_HELRO|nr:hypothetical protein HELRODRAFT_108742 [Helobdella robusta]ESN90685.1 hypothetical protein HELRODRAFT_108742 [Helobdella robusta]
MIFKLKALVAGFLSYQLYRFFISSEIDYKELLKNRNVLITGGSSGIGEEMAKYCAEAGSNVVIVARRKSLLDKVATDLRGLSPSPTSKMHYIVADFSDPDVSESVINEAIQFLGSLDYIIINHAIIPSSPKDVLKWSGNEHQRNQLASAMNINFNSYVTLATHALPYLHISNGSLLVVSSAMIDLPAFYLPYSTSKAAMSAFFTGIRQEIIQTKTNISVTIVHLGLIENQAGLAGCQQISASRGVDVRAILSMYAATDQKETGREIIWAAARKDAYFYYPRCQGLWILRVLRNLFSDPDRAVNTLESSVLYILDIKKKYFW